AGWSGRNFSPVYLSELALLDHSEPKHQTHLDANWITFAYGNDHAPKHWMERYWSGEAFPSEEPIWEMLLGGRALVLNTSLRERAYQVIKRQLPNAVAVLEMGRLAA